MQIPEPGSVHGDPVAYGLTAAPGPLKGSVEVVVLQFQQLQPVRLPATSTDLVGGGFNY
jgi:hypothetical protein